jgi:nitrite reductase/ring-hydroxylating ferredoxin subunit
LTSGRADVKFFGNSSYERIPETANEQASRKGRLEMAGMPGFIKAILGRCETQPLAGDLWSIENRTVKVKLGQVPELTRTGGAVFLEGQELEAPILLVRNGDNYLAFSNKCTHGGRKLDPVPEKSMLRCCSLSHSTYDYEGKKISGPAKGPITRYSAEVAGGELIVRL